jgi:hypothetical protein
MKGMFSTSSPRNNHKIIMSPLPETRTRLYIYQHKQKGSTYYGSLGIIAFVTAFPSPVVASSTALDKL